MTDVLALKYRPQKFSDVVGQKVNATVLARMVQNKKLPQGLLFTGPKGSGKTSVARIVASSIDAGEPIEVDAASHGGVDDVRRMLESLRFSTGHEHRVVIYDEAHSMTREAFNALLKTLEEPPAGTIFILVTTEPDKIPMTVKSRLMQFTFHKVSDKDIFDRLSRVQSIEGILVDIDLLHFISMRADGSMRDALMMLDQCWKAEISSKAEFMEMAGEEDVAVDLLLAMLTADHAHIYQVADDLSQRVPDPARLSSGIISTLKEVLILKAGGATEVTGEGLEKRKKLALHLEPERIVAGMKLLWDLRTRIRSSSEPRSNLDLALTLMTDIFTAGKKPVSVQKPVYSIRSTEMVEVKEDVRQEERRLDFAEL